MSSSNTLTIGSKAVPVPDSNALVSALTNLNISNLSPPVKAEWKRIGTEIAKVLPREEYGHTRINNTGGAMESLLSQLETMRERARTTDEIQLVEALEPVETFLRRVTELFAEVDAYKDAYKVFNEKLAQM